MNLPKLYRVVSVRFWGLRYTIGCGGGAEEIDKQVTRKARRVLCDDGWKWQLIDQGYHDCVQDSDNTCLNENPLGFIALGEDK